LREASAMAAARANQIAVSAIEAWKSLVMTPPAT
jgi:hypothetical protein